MRLILKRRYKGEEYTIGRLYREDNGQMIYLCDTLEPIDRGLKKTHPLASIKAKKVPGKTAIPYGTYAITLKVQSPKFRLRYWAKFCDGYLPTILGVPCFDRVLIHCLTPDTEILTEKGWQNMAQFVENPSENCYSYNTETGKAELVPIESFISREYDGLLYQNNGRRVNYSVTDQHRMYAGFKKRDGGYIWEFREAKDIPKNSVKFITAACKDGEDLLPWQKAFYRLLMATVADGYILNWSAKSSQVRFHLKKERKIERLKQLLSELGDGYNEITDNVGKTHISLKPELSELITEMLNPLRELSPKKELPWEILRLSSPDLKDLLMEYLFWDGRWENYIRNSKNMVISSTNPRTLDVLQSMATLCGMRSCVKEEKTVNRSRCYALCLYESQDIVTPDPDTYDTIPYKGEVWCMSNRNHTLIIRKGNRTMVIGNCGNTVNETQACVLVGFNRVKGKVLDSAATFEKVYRYLKEADDRGENLSITIE